MIDWDSLKLADPGRDVGPFLWWSVRPNRWIDFFKAYGEDIPDTAVYWWAAHASLKVALWFAEQGKGEEAAQFAADFAAASRMEENPRGS
ncbi:MAG TPA: hypothetical protein VF898_00760 [Chloroflexota bacterium]